LGPILGDPGAASWGDRIFTGESLQQGRDSPWAFTLIERVPEAFKIPLADWPENQEALPFLLLTFARENILGYLQKARRGKLNLFMDKVLL